MPNALVIPDERIENSILLIRGCKVMLVLCHDQKLGLCRMGK